MDATLQLARRLIARLLLEDAAFFREHHYLNPLGVDDSDQPMLGRLYAFVCRTREFLFLNPFIRSFRFVLKAFAFPFLVRLPQFCLKTCKLTQEELCRYLYL
jgi:hypothetical protein